MEFYPDEIAYMLRQYSEAEGVSMDFEAIAERLYYHTSGYPFLVSKLCKNIAELILPKRQDRSYWDLADVEASVQLLLRERNTNFDSLIKNLENNQNLYNLVYRVLVEGEVIPYNPDAPLAQLGRTYGIFRDYHNLAIHNRIYEQCIYNYMTAKRLQLMIDEKKYNFGDQFLTDDGALDLERVLRKFQSFMKQQYSAKNNQLYLSALQIHHRVEAVARRQSTPERPQPTRRLPRQTQRRPWLPAHLRRPAEAQLARRTNPAPRKGDFCRLGVGLKILVHRVNLSIKIKSLVSDSQATVAIFVIVVFSWVGIMDSAHQTFG